MPQNDLIIYSKNTEATATIKGYEYQKLKTLQTWLENQLAGTDEVIYCEHEDDIFQRDIAACISTFRQVKLYASKPFSFMAEEITKSLANFFMLYSKGEYSFDEVIFSFETNTGIARKYSENDADLLKEWNEHQGALKGDLLDRCATKAKSILTHYIKQQSADAEKSDKEGAEKAKKLFDELPDSVWQDFVQRVRWEFDGVDPDKAMEQGIIRIKELIQQLPFPSVAEQKEAIFTTLYYEVSERMFQDAPEDRALTNARLDSLMLDLGDDADKQYNIAYQAWTGVKEIQYFHPAEFFEVLHAATHCRRSEYLTGHSEFWKLVLQLYINREDTPDRYKLQALYEYLWLQFQPSMRILKPQGTLQGQESAIEKYFAMAFAADDREAVSDHFTLLQIVRTAIISQKCALSMKSTDGWLEEIGNIINGKLETITDPSERCFWWELQGYYYMNPLSLKIAGPDMERTMSAFQEIVNLLPDAPLYNVTRLSDRINQFISMMLPIDSTSPYIEKLEGYADFLMPFVTARYGDHHAAKTYVDRGVKYLHTTQPENLGRALSLFHKAKDLWLAAETIEGHVLALLNIAQLYLALRMNFAARYYLISAAWSCLNQNPEKMTRRLASSFGLLVHCDFKQGSWMQALTSFNYYMRLRRDYDGRPVENDKLFLVGLQDIANILYLAPLLSPQLTVFIEAQKKQMGDIVDIIKPVTDELQKTIAATTPEDVCQSRMDGAPLNDIGPQRKISFQAFGSTFKFSFQNSWMVNSIAEECIAILQILLVELSYAKTDLHLMRTTIEIEIVETAAPKPPEPLACGTHFKWKVYATPTDTKDNKEIRLHQGYIMANLQIILQEVSLLKNDGFIKHIVTLFQSEALGQKTATINLYQKIYRYLFSEERFSNSHRNQFDPVGVPFKLQEDVILRWNDSISPLYSKEESDKQITGRFQNTMKRLSRTVAHLKTLDGYQAFIDGLRADGWLDWQILMAIHNHIASYKANRLLKGQKFASEQQYVDALTQKFKEVMRMKEEEMYMEFPLSFFTDLKLGFQQALQQVTHSVLETWGLENRSQFLNFVALRYFLNKRFNFGTDDLPELSPL